MKEHILHVYQFNLNYATGLVADIPEDRMAEQPAANVNHPAWIIGHLANTAAFMGSLIGLESKLPDDWHARFGKGSTPGPDRSQYPDKQVLLDALKQKHDQVAAAFLEATPEQLASENPVESLRERFPKLGDLLTFGLTSHETLHLGQLSAWRRIQGFSSLT